MSVIVKGMEMPTTCCNCKFREPFIDFAYCHLAEMDMEYEESDNCRHPNCPLIELPPHGRLGDLDKLNIHDISPVDGFCVMGVTEEDIELAETVIEAEGET